MGIRAGARDDRPSAGVAVAARPFSSIDTTQQSELDISLNGGPLLPGGGISAVLVQLYEHMCAMTLNVENFIITMMNQEYSCTGMFLVLFGEQYANKKIIACDKNEQYEILKQNISYCSQK